MLPPLLLFSTLLRCLWREEMRRADDVRGEGHIIRDESNGLQKTRRLQLRQQSEEKEL